MKLENMNLRTELAQVVELAKVMELNWQRPRRTWALAPTIGIGRLQ